MLLPKMLNCFTQRFLFAVLALLLAGCANQSSYHLAAEGLVEVGENRYFDRILLPPGQSLPNFSKVYIEAAEVTFSDYWMRSFRGDYTSRDLDRLRTQYAGLLEKSLAKALDDHPAYTRVDSAAEADIIFRPHLDALNIYAPDLNYGARTEHYIHEAGNATLNLLLVDARTGAPLAQFVDHRETSSSIGQTRERTDRVTNGRYFGRMMSRWSNNLVDYLNENDAV